MAFDTAAAAKIFTEEFASAVEAAPAATASAAGVKAGDFCTIWRQVKPILEAVAKFIVFFPAFGSAAAAAITALLKVGDMIYEAQCK